MNESLRGRQITWSVTTAMCTSLLRRYRQPVFMPGAPMGSGDRWTRRSRPRVRSTSMANSKRSTSTDYEMSSVWTCSPPIASVRAASSLDATAAATVARLGDRPRRTGSMNSAVK